jgi:hypothetical protein
MKNKITLLVIGIVIVTIGIFVYVNRGTTPTVGADGKINGNYSIASIEALSKPYECAFSKSDGSAKVSGVIRTAEGKLRGDFDLSTTASTNAADQNPSNFASHLIVIDGTAYIWTSLQPIGYKNPVAQSASKGASPIEQAQIIGIKDKEDYACSPWNADPSTFGLPSSITFLEPK